MSEMKILVAEDEPFIRLHWERALVVEGFVPVLVEDGMQALRLLEGDGWKQFRALVTDLSMPNMNGLELIRQIRERRKMLIPTYLYTSYTVGEDPLTIEVCNRLVLQGAAIFDKAVVNPYQLAKEIKKNFLG